MPLRLSALKSVDPTVSAFQHLQLIVGWVRRMLVCVRPLYIVHLATLYMLASTFQWFACVTAAYIVFTSTMWLITARNDMNAARVSPHTSATPPVLLPRPANVDEAERARWRWTSVATPFTSWLFYLCTLQQEQWWDKMISLFFFAYERVNSHCQPRLTDQAARVALGQFVLETGLVLYYDAEASPTADSPLTFRFDSAAYCRRDGTLAVYRDFTVLIDPRTHRATGFYQRAEAFEKCARTANDIARVMTSDEKRTLVRRLAARCALHSDQDTTPAPNHDDDDDGYVELPTAHATFLAKYFLVLGGHVPTHSFATWIGRVAPEDSDDVVFWMQRCSEAMITEARSWIPTFTLYGDQYFDIPDKFMHNRASDFNTRPMFSHRSLGDPRLKSASNLVHFFLELRTAVHVAFAKHDVRYNPELLLVSIFHSLDHYGMWNYRVPSSYKFDGIDFHEFWCTMTRGPHCLLIDTRVRTAPVDYLRDVYRTMASVDLALADAMHFCVAW